MDLDELLDDLSPAKDTSKRPHTGQPKTKTFKATTDEFDWGEEPPKP